MGGFGCIPISEDEVAIGLRLQGMLSGSFKIRATTTGPKGLRGGSLLPEEHVLLIHLGIEVEELESHLLGEVGELTEEERDGSIRNRPGLVKVDVKGGLVVSGVARMNARVLLVETIDGGGPVSTVGATHKLAKKSTPINFTRDPLPDFLTHVGRDGTPGVLGISPIHRTLHHLPHPRSHILPLLIREFIPTLMVIHHTHTGTLLVLHHLLEVFILHEASEVLLTGEIARKTHNELGNLGEPVPLIGRKRIEIGGHLQGTTRKETALRHLLLGEGAIDGEVGGPIPSRVGFIPPLGGVLQGEVKCLMLQNATNPRIGVSSEEEGIPEHPKDVFLGDDPSGGNGIRRFLVERPDDVRVEGFMEEESHQVVIQVESRRISLKLSEAPFRKIRMLVGDLRLGGFSGALISGHDFLR